MEVAPTAGAVTAALETGSAATDNGLVRRARRSPGGLDTMVCVVLPVVLLGLHERIGG